MEDLLKYQKPKYCLKCTALTHYLLKAYIGYRGTLIYFNMMHLGLEGVTKFGRYLVTYPAYKWMMVGVRRERRNGTF